MPRSSAVSKARASQGQGACLEQHGRQRAAHGDGGDSGRLEDCQVQAGDGQNVARRHRLQQAGAGKQRWFVGAGLKACWCPATATATKPSFPPKQPAPHPSIHPPTPPAGAPGRGPSSETGPQSEPPGARWRGLQGCRWLAAPAGGRNAHSGGSNTTQRDAAGERLNYYKGWRVWWLPSGHEPLI